jgi:glutamate--cysteine ligase
MKTSQAAVNMPTAERLLGIRRGIEKEGCGHWLQARWP